MHTHTHCAVTSIFPIKHPKTDQTSSLTKQPSLCCPKRLIKRSSLDFKTDQCWSPSKGRYAMTNIIIILPSLCCHYRRLNIEPHSINDTQPSYHARTHSQSIVVANVSRCCDSHMLYYAVRLSLNGTIFDATFHNNMITHRCCCHPYNAPAMPDVSS